MHDEIVNQNDQIGHRSPEKLGEYIRAARPRAWVLLAVMLGLTALVLLWGAFARIPIHLQAEGVNISESSDVDKPQTDAVICFADVNEYTAQDLDGKDADVTFRDGIKAKGTTKIINTIPLASDELSDYLEQYQVDSKWANAFMSSYDYNYLFIVQLNEPMDPLYIGDVSDVSVIIGEIHPFSLLK